MNTDALIAEMALNARPVKRLKHARLCAEWLAAVVLSLLGVSVVNGLRPDLAARLAEPQFMAELLLNLMLVVVAGCAASAFAYPDRAKARVLTPLLLVSFVLYSALVLRTALQTPSLGQELATNAHHGFECLGCILSVAALPAVWMLWRLRRLASIKPMQAGAAALMMAVAAGCLGVRLVETEQATAGLLLWHYLPLLVLSALGLLLGKKLFRL